MIGRNDALPFSPPWIVEEFPKPYAEMRRFPPPWTKLGAQKN